MTAAEPPRPDGPPPPPPPPPPAWAAPATPPGPPAPASPAASAPALPPDPDGLGWRRMHPVTPALNAWKAVVAALAFGAWQVGPQMADGGWDLPGMTPVALVLGLVVVGALVGGAASALAWRRTRFAIDAERVYLESGIFFRRHRQARLDRVQAVDVVQPLVARLVGLAQVTIEQAGGQDSRVVLAYLTEAQAREIRNELLARAAGIDLEDVATSPQVGHAGAVLPAPGGAAPAPGAVDPLPADVAPADVATGTPALADRPGRTVGPVPAAGAVAGPARPRSRLAPEAPEREVLSVPTGRLLGSIVLSGAALTLSLLLVGLLVASVAAGSIGPLGVMLPALIGTAGYVWSRFTSEFDFRAATSPDGLRLRHGLTESRAQTVPPGRVQAVRLSQPLLWRGPGWWRVRVNVAGYGEADSVKESVLLPVGTRQEALLALWLVLPDLGEADAAAVLEAGLSGTDDGVGYLPSPRRARWLDPVAWRRNGLRVTPAALLLRSGRIERQLDVVPHERTQSLGLTQGPLQRRLALSTFVVHSTPGPVSPRVAHLDAEHAAELVMVQAERARTARAAAPPARWMRPPQD